MMRLIVFFFFLLVGWVLILEANAMIKIWMPGSSFKEVLPPLNDEEKAIKTHLTQHLDMLATKIGERHMGKIVKLQAAASYVKKSFADAGYKVRTQDFEVEGRTVQNIEAEHKGTTFPEEIIVIGAHYDTVPGSPGANDNGSGVASMLEIARLIAMHPLKRTVRFVAFANEEPPYFGSLSMGSYVYAMRSKERSEQIIGMMSLETMGYFSDEADSQQYPFPLNLLYPNKGNFIGFVSNTTSSIFLTRTVELFRKFTSFPSEGGAVPESFSGVGFSDHASFWTMGYPALMVTDTAFYRYPYYHTSKDLPDKVNTDALARITLGLSYVIGALAMEERRF